jgi:protoporphyrin/coproporphyrin ferrochelatase
VGTSKWLQPSLHKTLRDLAEEKVCEVCVVPVSFVSDHVETLGEIDCHARQEAAALGITRFEMTEGLNNSPTFIAALADLVLEALGSPRTKRSAEPFSAPGSRADDTPGDGIAASPS